MTYLFMRLYWHLLIFDDEIAYAEETSLTDSHSDEIHSYWRNSQGKFSHNGHFCKSPSTDQDKQALTKDICAKWSKLSEKTSQR